MSEIRQYLEKMHAVATAKAAETGEFNDFASAAWWRNTLARLGETEQQMDTIAEQVRALLPRPPMRDLATGPAIAEALTALLAEVNASTAELEAYHQQGRESES